MDGQAIEHWLSQIGLAVPRIADALEGLVSAKATAQPKPTPAPRELVHELREALLSEMSLWPESPKTLDEALRILESKPYAKEAGIRSLRAAMAVCKHADPTPAPREKIERLEKAWKELDSDANDKTFLHMRHAVENILPHADPAPATGPLVNAAIEAAYVWPFGTRERMEFVARSDEDTPDTIFARSLLALRGCADPVVSAPIREAAEELRLDMKEWGCPDSIAKAERLVNLIRSAAPSDLASVTLTMPREAWQHYSDNLDSVATHGIAESGEMYVLKDLQHTIDAALAAKPEPTAFRKHLEENREIVASWPKWEQNVLKSDAPAAPQSQGLADAVEELRKYRGSRSSLDLMLTASGYVADFLDRILAAPKPANSPEIPDSSIEKHRRIYYQTLAYHVCDWADGMLGVGMRMGKNPGVVCGTYETPSEGLQKALKEIEKNFRERVAAACRKCGHAARGPSGGCVVCTSRAVADGYRDGLHPDQVRTTIPPALAAAIDKLIVQWPGGSVTDEEFIGEWSGNAAAINAILAAYRSLSRPLADRLADAGLAARDDSLLYLGKRLVAARAWDEENDTPALWVYDTAYLAIAAEWACSVDAGRKSNA